MKIAQTLTKVQQTCRKCGAKYNGDVMRFICVKETCMGGMTTPVYEDDPLTDEELREEERLIRKQKEGWKKSLPVHAAFLERMGFDVA